MNPIMMAKIAAVVIAVIAIFFTGEKVERAKWQEREIELNQKAVEAKELADKKANSIASEYEVLKSSKQSTQNTISRNLTNELIQNRDQYGCPIPDAGKLLISSSITNANSSSAGKSSGKLSKD